jgi:diguanylate cyclase (GGDEF)-like protein
MNAATQSLQSVAEVRPDERLTVGRVGAGLWVIASLSIVVLSLVLPAGEVNRPALLAMGGAGCLWGMLGTLVLDFRRLPVWIVHISTTVGTAGIAVVIALSGGARSPAWACLFYVVVFAAYFFRPPAAAFYFLLCVVVECVVVGGSSPANRHEAVGRLVVAAPAFIVLGAAIVAGKQSMYQLRRRAERLAAQQAALRRVATAAVSGEPAESFYGLVACEAAKLMSAGAAGILRLDGRGEAVVLGSWANEPARTYGVGTSFPVPRGSDVATALDQGRPVHIQQRGPESSIGRLGYSSSIVAPVKVGGRLWGFLAVVAVSADELGEDHVDRLNEFADLISTATTSIEDRAALAAQAATDPLTGVGNHRTFHQRLNADLARARRYGTPVAVALIDVDHFKQVNDTHGHDAGDAALVRVARCLNAAARAEDTVARIGGDEFAWILPETAADEALAAVQRARDGIIAGDAGDVAVTISGGVCDTQWTSDPTELVRLTDRALYRSKDNGRDQVLAYSPEPAGDVVAPRVSAPSRRT